MKLILVAVMIVLVGGCALSAGTVGDDEHVSTTTTSQNFCVLDDNGDWIGDTCGSGPGGGTGGGGDLPLSCTAQCDPTWGGQDLYCTTSCGFYAKCYSVYRCGANPWDYSCPEAHLGYCM